MLEICNRWHVNVNIPHNALFLEARSGCYHVVLSLGDHLVLSNSLAENLKYLLIDLWLLESLRSKTNLAVRQMNGIIRETWHHTVNRLVQQGSRQLARQVEDVGMTEQSQRYHVALTIHNRHRQNPAATLSKQAEFTRTLNILSLLGEWQVKHFNGYAIQHIWCLSQARIKWKGCGRKGIWHKNGGMMEVGCWLVRMESCPPGWLVCLPLLSSLAP